MAIKTTCKFGDSGLKYVLIVFLYYYYYYYCGGGGGPG